MAFLETFDEKLKTASGQLAVAWLKDNAKTAEEKGWAKSQLLTCQDPLNGYLTVQLQAAGVTKDTEFAAFKTALEALLPDAFLAFTAGVTVSAPSTTPEVVLGITKLALMNRFTNAEYAAILTAMKSNLALEVLMNKLMAASYIDLTREDTVAGIGALASAGLITVERATAILTDPIQDIEKYILR